MDGALLSLFILVTRNIWDPENSTVKHYDGQKRNIRVFPKVDHSANVARIVLVEYIIESVVELIFC